jgi:hypothetical protein
MNTSDLKLNIIRQVDSLDDDILKEIIDYIQLRINDSGKSVLHSLNDEQKQGIIKAQNSIKNNKGIPHTEIVEKYRIKYGRS